jgi:hypothetical protein
MQSNRKTREGGNHPDRDTQFEFIILKRKRNAKRNAICKIAIKSGHLYDENSINTGRRVGVETGST